MEVKYKALTKSLMDNFLVYNIYQDICTDIPEPEAMNLFPAGYSQKFDK